MFQALLIVLAFGMFSPTLASAQFPALPDIPVTKITLENGLRVLIHEDHKAPIVAVNVWYHVGSKNEPEGRHGFAHLFEHLLFQGSENVKADYIEGLEKIGATDFNGTTNLDRTNYFQNVPVSALDTILFMESDRMGHFSGAISQAKLDEQRDVVLNEKRQGENRPYWGQAWNLIHKGAFPKGHPYSWTVIGDEADLKGASLADVKDWFHKYYGPNNAVLTIVGDVKTETAIEKVKKYFGDIPPGPRIARVDEWIAKRQETKRESVEDNVPFPKLLKIWNVPGTKEMDLETLDMISSILSEGKSSRLYKDIVYDQKLASEISTGVLPGEIASLFIIDATAKPGVSLAKLEQAIESTMKSFLVRGPTESELYRAKMKFAAGFIDHLEKVGGFGGKANVLATGEVMKGDYDAYRKEFGHRLNLQPMDLARVGREWLSSGDYNLEITPFPKFSSQKSSVNRSRIPDVGPIPAADFPTVQESTLSNGVRVLLMERNHIPNLEIGLLVPAGYAKEPKGKKGLAGLTFGLMDQGTQRRNLFEISDRLSMLGSSIRPFSGVHFSGFYAHTLTNNATSTLELLSEIVRSPAMLPKELERLKKETIESIEQEKVDPAGLAKRVFPQTLYGEDHPYGVPLSGLGYASDVESITDEDVRAFYKSWVKPNQATIIVAGDISIKPLTVLLEKTFGAWERGESPKFSVPEVSVEKNRGKIFLIDRPHSPQTYILAGHFFPDYATSDEEAISIVNSIFGGSISSRINMNLRENKGWSYGARTGAMDLEGARILTVRAPVQTDKTAASVLEIMKEYRGITSSIRPITKAEFDIHKTNALAEIAGSWETNEAVYSSVESLVTHGVKVDYLKGYGERLKKVTWSEVSEVAKKTIHPDHLTWVLVGDREKILPEVKKLGMPVVLLDGDGNPIEGHTTK